ncbi:MAG: type II CAAX endopeptidase family protein [Chryseolinea sp.]
MQQELRPLWSRLFFFNWKVGLFLILAVCIPRFFLVLYANASGNYGSIGIIMMISAALPFIFLTKYGRTRIGIVNPEKYYWLLVAFVSGLGFSVLLYLIGEGLYGQSYENWYVYIGRSYNLPENINAHDKQILFWVVAGTGMIFSPIGEELFFRGIVHSSIASSTGERKASIIDSAVFALTHLSHFGLVLMNNEWKILPFPSLIWLTSMFLASLLFFTFKKYSGSLLGAIICHAAFNLGMTYCIFYLLP